MPKKLRNPPAVATNEGLAIAEKAAEAVGMSIEDLADALIDGGVTALPPSDGITQRYTLEDLGLRLWGNLQEKPRSKRSEWFAALLPQQQTAVIVVLRHRDYPTDVIAREFGISNRKVVITWNKHADDLGAQVVGLRLNTIAGQMQIMKEKAQKMAHDRNDPKAMWAIEKDSITILQSLGIVDSATRKIEHTVKFDDQRKAELDAMVTLRLKQQQRHEEIKQIEATVLDEPPEIEEDYD